MIDLILGVFDQHDEKAFATTLPPDHASLPCLLDNRGNSTAQRRSTTTINLVMLFGNNLRFQDCKWRRGEEISDVPSSVDGPIIKMFNAKPLLYDYCGGCYIVITTPFFTNMFVWLVGGSTLVNGGSLLHLRFSYQPLQGCFHWRLDWGRLISSMCSN